MMRKLSIRLLFLCFLCLAAAAVRAEDTEATPPPRVQVRLVGADLSGAGVMPPPGGITDSYFFRNETGTDAAGGLKRARGFYRQIYPGIDMACYGDDHHMEYVFAVSAGADPMAVTLLIDGVQGMKLNASHGVTYPIPDGEIIQSRPVVFHHNEDGTREIDSGYEVGAANRLTVDLRQMIEKAAQRMKGHTMRRVTKGGQPGGPAYDFFLSKFELTNEQLVEFLNDAQSSPKSPGGSNMFFDEKGNAWFNPAKKQNRDELFSIGSSKLVYDPSKPEGQRYEHRRSRDGTTRWTRYPAQGLSWFGGVKYCNWLTIASGRGSAETCYREGPTPADWAPVGATNWSAGVFTAAERTQWLQMRGFRLPMLDTNADTIGATSFNEFFKAAAWRQNTNVGFGYGRSHYGGLDANFSNITNRPWEDVSPVGFFSGKTALGKIQTTANLNYFGIFDLSGNVTEWVNDFGRTNDPSTRGACGGSWSDEARPVCCGDLLPPSTASRSGGIRACTTFMPDESLAIHILLSFYLNPPPAMPIAEEGGTIETAKQTPPAEPATPENATPQPGPDTEPFGLIYTTTPTEPPPTTTTQRPGEPDRPTPNPNPEPPISPPGTNEPSVSGLVLSVRSVNPNSGIPVAITDASGAIENTAFARTYATGTVVTLSAPYTSANNTIFSRWDCSDNSYDSTSTSVTVNVTANLTMTAIYADPVTLSIGSVSPNFGLSVSVNQPDVFTGLTDGDTTFSRDYAINTLVWVAAPQTNYLGASFHHWLVGSVPGSGVLYSFSRTIVVNMVSDIAYTAVYLPHTLFVESSGADSVPIAISQPDLFGDSDGITGFNRRYDADVYVELTAPAIASNGYVFREWLVDGVSAGTNLTTAVIMTADIYTVAVYRYVPEEIDDPTISPGGI